MSKKLKIPNNKNKLTPAWLKRAVDPNSPQTNWDESVRTISSEHPKTGKEILFPTIRMVNGKLIRMNEDDAFTMALNFGDYLEFDSAKDATEFSKTLSEQITQQRLLIK